MITQICHNSHRLEKFLSSPPLSLQRPKNPQNQTRSCLWLSTSTMMCMRGSVWPPLSFMLTEFLAAMSPVGSWMASSNASSTGFPDPEHPLLSGEMELNLDVDQSTCLSQPIAVFLGTRCHRGGISCSLLVRFAFRVLALAMEISRAGPRGVGVLPLGLLPWPWDSAATR